MGINITTLSRIARERGHQDERTRRRLSEALNLIDSNDPVKLADAAYLLRLAVEPVAIDNRCPRAALKALEFEALRRESLYLGEPTQRVDELGAEAERLQDEAITMDRSNP